MQEYQLKSRKIRDALLEAQELNLRQYALQKGFDVVKVFSFSESAGDKIRTQFEQVIKYLRNNKDIKILLAENVDRLTRNMKDAVELDDLRLKEGLEIHFRQDNFIFNASSKSNELFLWDIKVLLSKNFLNRIKEDSTRSMEQKLKNR